MHVCSAMHVLVSLCFGGVTVLFPDESSLTNVRNLVVQETYLLWPCKPHKALQAYNTFQGLTMPLQCIRLYKA